MCTLLEFASVGEKCRRHGIVEGLPGESDAPLRLLAHFVRGLHG